MQAQRLLDAHCEANYHAIGKWSVPVIHTLIPRNGGGGSHSTKENPRGLHDRSSLNMSYFNWAVFLWTYF
jgi:hypothetical protein